VSKVWKKHKGRDFCFTTIKHAMRYSFSFSLMVFTALYLPGLRLKKIKDYTENPDGNWPWTVFVSEINLNFPWDIFRGKSRSYRDDGKKKWHQDQAKIRTKRYYRFDFQISDIDSQGEGGLLGMAHHPDCLNNWFPFTLFIIYNRSGVYTEKVVRVLLCEQYPF
jgi:hypothetical protein